MKVVRSNARNASHSDDHNPTQAPLHNWPGKPGIGRSWTVRTTLSTPPSSTPTMATKTELRALALASRKSQSNRQQLSQQIVERFLDTPEYASAETVLFYVDVRDEVQTRQAIPAALASGKRIVVPYCVGRELALFHLRSFTELEPGAFGILEPATYLRDEASRRVLPQDLDLVLVPGVAFDLQANRLGYGQGFYDRLLETIRPGTARIAVAFDSQIVPQIPVASHDIPMTQVLTESRTLLP